VRPFSHLVTREFSPQSTHEWDATEPVGSKMFAMFDRSSKRSQCSQRSYGGRPSDRSSVASRLTQDSRVSFSNLTTHFDALSKAEMIVPDLRPTGWRDRRDVEEDSAFSGSSSGESWSVDLETGSPADRFRDPVVQCRTRGRSSGRSEVDAEETSIGCFVLPLERTVCRGEDRVR